MSPLLVTALDVAMGLFAVAMALCAWRLLRGPAAVDRIVALDTLYMAGCGLLVLAGLRLGSALHGDAALVIALLGFGGTAAAALFLVRGTPIE